MGTHIANSELLEMCVLPFVYFKYVISWPQHSFKPISTDLMSSGMHRSVSKRHEWPSRVGATHGLKTNMRFQTGASSMSVKLCAIRSVAALTSLILKIVRDALPTLHAVHHPLSLLQMVQPPQLYISAPRLR